MPANEAAAINEPNITTTTKHKNQAAVKTREGVSVICDLECVSAYRGVETCCSEYPMRRARRRWCKSRGLAPLRSQTCTQLFCASVICTQEVQLAGSCTKPSALRDASSIGSQENTARAKLMLARSPLLCAKSSQPSSNGSCSSNCKSECRSESNDDRPRDQRATGPAPVLRVGELPAQAAGASGQPARLVSLGGWHPRWVHGPENRATVMSRDGSIPSPSANSLCNPECRSIDYCAHFGCPFSPKNFISDVIFNSVMAAFERLSNLQIVILRTLLKRGADARPITLARWMRRSTVHLWRSGLIEIWYRQSLDHGSRGPFYTLTIVGARLAHGFLYPAPRGSSGAEKGK